MFIKVSAKPGTQMKGTAAEDRRGENLSGHADNIRMTVAFVRSAILIVLITARPESEKTERVPEKVGKQIYKQKLIINEWLPNTVNYRVSAQSADLF